MMMTVAVCLEPVARAHARTAFVCEGQIGNAATDPNHALAGDFEYDIGTNTAAPYATGQFAWPRNHPVPFVMEYNANSRIARFELGSGGALAFPLNAGAFTNTVDGVASLSFRLRAVTGGASVTLTNLVLQLSSDPNFLWAGAFGPVEGDGTILTNVPTINLQGGFRLDGQAIFCWDTNNPPGRSRLAFQISVEEPVVTEVAWDHFTENDEVKGGSLFEVSGGYAVFPEANSSYDLHRATRQRVVVKATLDQQVEGIPVYFKALDVDDPSTNLVVDANDAMGAKGDDNRSDWSAISPRGQFVGSGTEYIAYTDANGVAEAIFETARQPGNNYRVAASTARMNLDVLTITNGVADLVYVPPDNGPTLAGFDGRLTSLLTVWRTVHVELDSMGAVTNNDRSGYVTELIRNLSGMPVNLGVDQNLTYDDTSPNFSGPHYGNGRYENGTVEVGIGPNRSITTGIRANGRDFFLAQPPNGFCILFRAASPSLVSVGRVLEWQGNTEFLVDPDGPLNNTVAGGDFDVAGVRMTVSSVVHGGEPGVRVTIAEIRPIPFGAHDDDPDLTNPTIMPKTPDVGYLSDALAEVYVVPEYNQLNDVTVNHHPVVPFQLNTPTEGLNMLEQIGQTHWDSRASNTNDFWIVYVLQAWQPETGADGDPDPEDLGLQEGLTWGWTVRTNTGTSGMTVIFQAVCHEPVLLPESQSTSAVEKEQIIVVHEIGHAMTHPWDLALIGCNDPHPVTNEGY